MNKKWINNALSSWAYSSFEGVSSDHRIVTAKIPLSRRRNAFQKTMTLHLMTGPCLTKEILAINRR